MRIISLLASATEMVDALGCLDQLVGRSHECDYPPQIQTLPVVSRVQIEVETSSAQIDAQIKRLAQNQRGEQPQNEALKALSIYAIDIEQLQALRPDVILTQTQCDVCAVSERDVMEAVRHLTGLHPKIISLSPHQLSDVWEDVIRVGRVLKREEQAHKLIDGYQQRLTNLQTRTAAFREKPHVTMLEWLDPLMSAGNWAPELLEIAGGKPDFGERGQHSPWLSWEELETANPDFLILSPCGFSLKRTHVDLPLLRQHPIWQRLRAVQTGQVYAIDGNYYLNRSGPRLVESAELVANILWGERLGLKVDPQAWEKIEA